MLRERYLADPLTGRHAYRDLVEPSPLPAEYNTIQVDCSNGGIGDVVMGCGCAQALMRQDGARRVYLLCRPGELQWARLFLGADQCGSVRIDGGTTCRPVDTYDAELAEHRGAPRWERYGRACGVEWSPPSGAEVGADAKWWAETHRGAVVLAPFASHKCRAWEPSHWRALAQDLHDAGYHPVVIDDGLPGDDRRVQFHCPRLSNATAEQIAALIRAAHVVVSNDSGMAHVGAALGATTVVLCGQQLGARIYGAYPSARVIQGPSGCTGCHWRGEWGWHTICDQLCAALNLIQPADVLKHVGPYSLLPSDRLEQLRLSVAATAGLGGCMAEVGVFRGGSAREIHRADPVRCLHLFDTFRGLPGPNRTGQYSARLDQVRNYVQGMGRVVYHPGEFGADLPPDPVRYSLVHLDADLYDSTYIALDYFLTRMVAGGHIVLDDLEQEPGVGQALADHALTERVERCADHQGRLVCR